MVVGSINTWRSLGTLGTHIVIPSVNDLNLNEFNSISPTKFVPNLAAIEFKYFRVAPRMALNIY